MNPRVGQVGSGCDGDAAQIFRRADMHVAKSLSVEGALAGTFNSGFERRVDAHISVRQHYVRYETRLTPCERSIDVSESRLFEFPRALLETAEALLENITRPSSGSAASTDATLGPSDTARRCTRTAQGADPRGDRRPLDKHATTRNEPLRPEELQIHTADRSRTLAFQLDGHGARTPEHNSFE